jgi:hypothetical protein
LMISCIFARCESWVLVLNYPTIMGLSWGWLVDDWWMIGGWLGYSHIDDLAEPTGKSCPDFEDQFHVALTGHFPNLWWTSPGNHGRHPIYIVT